MTKKCEDCGTVFDRLTYQIITDCDGLAFELPVTPCCNSEFFDDIHICDCGHYEAMEGADDCAVCIYSDQYSHTKNYDSDDYAMALKELPVMERVFIDEALGRQYIDEIQ